MKYLNDDAEKKLGTRQLLQEYLDFRKENDEWIYPFCNECATIGINKFGEIKKEENNPTITSELIQESMEYKLLLVFPKDMKPTVMPIRYTAFPDICSRAGLKGRTIELMNNKGNIACLDPILRGQWLSTGLSLNSNECKILIRDEKISSMKSHEYQIFPEHRIISILEQELESSWADYEYLGGHVSHEYLYVEYALNADDMESAFKFKLEDMGIPVESIKAGISMSTSDVGNSSVILNTHYIVNGVPMRLGKPIYVRHDVSNTFDTISEKIKIIGAMFKEAEDEIETLGNTKIQFPKETFMNIVTDYKLPKKIAEQLAPSLDMVDDCNAVDIFIKLNELVELHYKSSKMSLSSFILEQETVAKMLYLDYSKYDTK